MDKSLRKGLRTWIEIDKGAIKHNFSVFRKLITKKTKLLAVVKSNAYGHDLFQFSKEMQKLGADFLGVDSIIEAIALRREGIKIPIFVLGYTLPENIHEAIAKNISIAVSSFETLKAISNMKGVGKIKIHIKVDTGMNRHGFVLKDLQKVMNILKKLKNAEVEGLFTHFSNAKNPAFPTYTKKQIAEFDIWSLSFLKAGYTPIRHASATSGALIFRNANFDMVRVGIGLYGIWPSSETREYLKDKITLKSVMTWKTIVAEVKEIPSGSKVGYDCTEVVDRKTKVAVCPIGYWHGYPRALSSIGRLSVGGKKAKILGRVCMDIVMLDVTDIKNVKVGDEVTILGGDIKVEDVVGPIDASAYEFVTRINPLIRRAY